MNELAQEEVLATIDELTDQLGHVTEKRMGTR